MKIRWGVKGFPWALLFAVAACNFRVEKEGVQKAKEELSFAAVKQVLFEPKCASCHGLAGDFNCSTYAGVKQRLDRVEYRVLTKRDMPPSQSGELSREQLELLSRWIAAGAPEWGPAGGPPPVEKPPPQEKPLEPTFASIREKIFVPMCIGCHTQGHPGEKVPLNSKEELISSPRLLVLPGNAAESGLYLSVRPRARKPMPPVDSGIRRLTVEEVAVIVDWINAGAKD